MSVYTRLFAGLLAGAFGQVVTVGIQLGGLPVFLWVWGPHLYGEWLLLSAIPAYLSVSDLGFSSVASNQMTMDVASGRRLNALSAFHSTYVIVVSASVIVTLVSICIGVLPIERWLNIGLISHLSVAWILLWTSAQVVLGFLNGLISAAYRCEGGYARVTVLSNMVRLAEFIGACTALLASGNPVIVAAVTTCVRAVGLLCLRLDVRRFAPWITFSFQHASWTSIRSLAGPALAFAIWPIAAAVQQQGLVLVIGSILGSSAVVVWSACRTVARALFQASGVLNGAIWPELSRSLGAGEVDVARRLHRFSMSIAIWTVIPFSIVLWVMGDRIFSIWSHGVVTVSKSLFGLTLFQTIINLMWGTSSVVAAAVNRHQRNSFLYVILILIGTGLAAPITKSAGLQGATLAILIADLAMFPATLFMALSISHDRLTDFCSSAFRPPFRNVVVALRRHINGAP